MLSFEFELDPLKNSIRGANRVLSNLEEFFRDMAVPELKKIFRRVFDREGAVDPFSRWDPLSVRYARQKARRYPGTKINERTGQYKRSLTERPYVAIKRNQLVYGSRVRHGIYVERGSRSQRRPPRSVFERVVHPQQAPTILRRRLQEYVVKKLNTGTSS